MKKILFYFAFGKKKFDVPREDYANWLVEYLKNMDVEEHRQPIFVDLDCRSNNAEQENISKEKLILRVLMSHEILTSKRSLPLLFNFGTKWTSDNVGW
jgi:hypothetical protein